MIMKTSRIHFGCFDHEMALRLPYISLATLEYTIVAYTRVSRF
jgi:hypothetical protein